MTGGSLSFIIFSALLFFTVPAIGQDTAFGASQRVNNGGFVDFHINGGSIRDFLDLVYKKRGYLFYPEITVYTDAHVFRGMLIQEADDFIVLYQKLSPETESDSIVSETTFKLHYIRTGDIQSISAEGATR